MWFLYLKRGNLQMMWPLIIIGEKLKYTWIWNVIFSHHSIKFFKYQKRICRHSIHQHCDIQSSFKDRFISPSFLNISSSVWSVWVVLAVGSINLSGKKQLLYKNLWRIYISIKTFFFKKTSKHSLISISMSKSLTRIFSFFKLNWTRNLHQQYVHE